MLDNIDQNHRYKLKLDNLTLPSPERHRQLRHQMSTDNMNVPPFNIPNLRVERRKTSSAEDMARKNSIGAQSATGSVGGGFKSKYKTSSTYWNRNICSKSYLTITQVLGSGNGSSVRATRQTLTTTSYAWLAHSRIGVCLITLWWLQKFASRPPALHHPEAPLETQGCRRAGTPALDLRNVAVPLSICRPLP